MVKFSTPSDCLKSGIQGQKPQMNWRKLRSPYEIQICLFLVAEDLDDPQEFMAFLSTYGFSTYKFDSVGSYPTQKPFKIGGTHHLGRIYEPYFIGPDYYLARVLGRSVSYNEFGKPFSSNVHINFL
jgi:hypothetical protein